jgi:tRNA (adenine57-N1/adenine58-N1)-methyltransferase
MSNSTDEPGVLREGMPVIFIDRKGRTYYDQLMEDKVSNCGGKQISHAELIGQQDGLDIKSRQGPRFRVFSASYREHVTRMSRHAQIIHPKDAAIIVAWTDLHEGARVVEGGLGSGALATAILRAIGSSGHLTTYELRQEPTNLALKNVRSLMGETKNHMVRVADIYDGLEEQNIDSIILDVPEPWLVVEHAAAALRSGGHFAAYVPTALQMQQVVLALEGTYRFGCIESLETILRNWHVTGRSLRPEHKIMGHTGFLVFARRKAQILTSPDGPKNS